MKILVTRFPYESAEGGAEIQTASLMRGLKDRGHDVTFLGSCPVLLRKAQENGIRAEALAIGPPPVTKLGAVTFLWRRLMMQAKLNEAVDALGRFDAVIMLSLSEKLLLTKRMANENTRIVWLEHDPIGRWLTANPWLPRLLSLSTHATTVTVSHSGKRLYVQAGWKEERVAVVPNGIDPDRFSIPKRHHAGNTLRITCISRLAREKGLDVLIDAMRKTPDTHLSIVGQGSQRHALNDMIASYDLGDRVRMANEVDLAEAYASTDVLVLPSRTHDPFGLVVAEAMALGIPVIVTNACGIADYLTHGKDALIVEAGSSEALVKELSSLRDSARRNEIGATGKRTALAEFTLSKMIDSYAILLKAHS